MNKHATGTKTDQGETSGLEPAAKRLFTYATRSLVPPRFQTHMTMDYRVVLRLRLGKGGSNDRDCRVDDQRRVVQVKELLWPARERLGW
jgi:hypothetical protein